MGKTTLTNNSGSNVQVKEWNSIIFNNVQVLKPGSTMTIKADSSASYREYVLTVLPDNKKLRSLTSNNIRVLPAIEIFKDEGTGEVDWTELRTEAEKKSWLGYFLGLFSRKSGAKKTDAKADSSKSPTETR